MTKMLQNAKEKESIILVISFILFSHDLEKKQQEMKEKETTEKEKKEQEEKEEQKKEETPSPSPEQIQETQQEEKESKNQESTPESPIVEDRQRAGRQTQPQIETTPETNREEGEKNPEGRKKTVIRSVDNEISERVKYLEEEIIFLRQLVLQSQQNAHSHNFCVTVWGIGLVLLFLCNFLFGK